MSFHSLRTAANALDGLHEKICALGLHRAEAGKVILSPSGKTQNWLIDLRRVFLDRPALEQIADAFWQRHKGFGAFQLGAMETAAIPLLAALLLRAPQGYSNTNGFIVRKDRKSYGLGNAIEGEVDDVPIILVDDVLNSGASLEKARAVIAQAGRDIAEMFVVVDYRSAKGLHWRQEHDIPILSLFTLADFGLELRHNPGPPRQKYRELWRTAIPGANPYHVVPKSGPLLVGNRIFRGCDAGSMHCFDADTGAVIWEYKVTGAAPRKGIWSSPAFAGCRIYFGAYNGVVYCLDAKTGEEVWQQSCCEWVGASPIVVAQHGLVFIGLEYERPWAQGGIAALDIKTGHKVWERPVKKYQHGSPAYWEAGDLIIWGTADHQMTGLDAKTGKPLWSFPTRRSVKYAPAVDASRGLVAFASFDKSIYVVEAATGAKRGEWQTDEICYTTPLFLGDKLFCGSGDRHLYVIDLRSMEIIKKLDMKARVYSSPRNIGGRVVFGTNGGRIIELDPDTLEIEGVLQLPDAVTNAVAAMPGGDRIFVSTYMNHLLAFERLR
jgi:outer membrane protein assembly factor BamB/adenine/guanine phosphoribosyltransferase-like PRPP-binding protein